jgi:hypothetical protein
MPRGGNRGGGRPTKAAQLEKERLLVEAIKTGPKISPRVLLQGVMDSVGSTRMEKMKAVELYMKLPPESAPASSVDNSERSLIAYSLPRGSSIDTKTGEITFPEGVEPEPVVPFKPTADWTKTPLADRRDQRAEPACEPFEVTEAEVPQNVTRLDTFVRKRDSDEQGPGDAA